MEVIYDISAGLLGGVIAFLLTYVFTKKGPKGETGTPGMQGRPGPIGMRGKDASEFTGEELRQAIKDIWKYEVLPPKTQEKL